MVPNPSAQPCSLGNCVLSLSLCGQKWLLRTTISAFATKKCVGQQGASPRCHNHFAICAAFGSLSSVALPSLQMAASLSDRSCFRHFVVLTLGASSRAALQCCLILLADGNQSIISILFSSLRGLDIGVNLAFHSASNFITLHAI